MPTFIHTLLLRSALCILIPSSLIAQSYGGSSDLRITDMVYGTLLTPETATIKLAIIIPDSGPTDRDGNQQMMRNNALKLLAEGLAQEGIASFRYDKSVLTLLRKNALQEEKLDFTMFINDAVSVVNYFTKQGRFKEIFIIGHGQGSLIGMVAAQRVPYTGFISLTGAGQSIDKTIINQIALQMPDLEDKAVTAFKTLREKGKVKDYSPALASIFRPTVQPFMASWMQYDPSVELAKLTKPMLIIDGTNDLQVSQQETQMLQAAAPEASIAHIEGMNHVLRLTSNDDLENSKTYNNTSLPIATALVEVISDFIYRE